MLNYRQMFKRLTMKKPIIGSMTASIDSTQIRNRTCKNVVSSLSVAPAATQCFDFVEFTPFGEACAAYQADVVHPGGRESLSKFGQVKIPNH